MARFQRYCAYLLKISATTAQNMNFQRLNEIYKASHVQAISNEQKQQQNPLESIIPKNTVQRVEKMAKFAPNRVENERQ